MVTYADKAAVPKPPIRGKLEAPLPFETLLDMDPLAPRAKLAHPELQTLKLRIMEEAAKLISPSASLQAINDQNGPILKFNSKRKRTPFFSPLAPRSVWMAAPPPSSDPPTWMKENQQPPRRSSCPTSLGQSQKKLYVRP